MADTLDVLTLDEGRRAINRSSGTLIAEDDIVARHITAISRLMDDRCGPVVQRTVANEIHSGGTATILLHRRPVAAITTVTEYRDGASTVLAESTFGTMVDGYLSPTWPTDPSLRTGSLRRWNYDTDWSWTATRVSYTAGRFATTATVDARFKDTAGAILRRLWKREAGSWAQSPTFYEDGDPNAGTGFFRVADPILMEMLTDEIRREPLIA